MLDTKLVPRKLIHICMDRYLTASTRSYGSEMPRSSCRFCR